MDIHNVVLVMHGDSEWTLLFQERHTRIVTLGSYGDKEMRKRSKSSCCVMVKAEGQQRFRYKNYPSLQQSSVVRTLAPRLELRGYPSD
jgi:hypothetical protein